jgi:hypothetical protein
MDVRDKKIWCVWGGGEGVPIVGKLPKQNFHYILPKNCVGVSPGGVLPIKSIQEDNYQLPCTLSSSLDVIELNNSFKICCIPSDFLIILFEFTVTTVAAPT